MTTFTTVPRLVSLSAAGLLLTAGLSGCSSADVTVACAKVQAELASITSQGVTLISDPQKLRTAYVDSANRLRGIAKGTEIANETEAVAVALEKLGKQVADFAAAPGAGVPQLSTTELTNAGASLRQACS